MCLKKHNRWLKCLANQQGGGHLISVGMGSTAAQGGFVCISNVIMIYFLYLFFAIKFNHRPQHLKMGGLIFCLDFPSFLLYPTPTHKYPHI